MKNCVRIGRYLRVAAICVAMMGTAQAATIYSVTELFSVRSVARGINDLGQVVGSYLPTDGVQRPFVYSAGTLQDPGMPAGVPSGAIAINNSGQIAGWAFEAVGKNLFLSINGVVTDLVPIGWRGFPKAISNDGQVVGYTGHHGDILRAFMYDAGAMTDLGTLGVSGAEGINNSGEIVGWSWTADGSIRSFIYSGGILLDLGTPSGAQAKDINNLGQVTGTFYGTYGSLPGTAFLYSEGTFTDLGARGGEMSYAWALNDGGQVVGEYANTFEDYDLGGSRAFLYDNGVMTDLNDLIDPIAGWFIQAAFDINSSASIAASLCRDDHSECRGVVLELVSTEGGGDVPEPGVLALLGIGLVGFAAGRARRRLD